MPMSVMQLSKENTADREPACLQKHESIRPLILNSSDTHPVKVFTFTFHFKRVKLYQVSFQSHFNADTLLKAIKWK